MLCVRYQFGWFEINRIKIFTKIKRNKKENTTNNKIQARMSIKVLMKHKQNVKKTARKEILIIF